MGYKSKLKQMRRLKESVLSDLNNSDWEDPCTSYIGERVQEEDCWLSMKKECDAIVKNKSDLSSPYQAARVLLYKTLLEEKDNLKQDANISKKVDLNIRKAGEMLYASGGMNDMHDRLLWIFIPPYLRRYIDYNWNGIGEWLA